MLMEIGNSKLYIRNLKIRKNKFMSNDRLNNELKIVLFNMFDVDVVPDYEGLKRYLRHKDFPNREKEFKKELANAIKNHTLTPNIYEDLTNHDLETQEEVDEFLKTEIWQPLYDDEPIELES